MQYNQLNEKNKYGGIMRKLSLANMAQNELQKNETQKVKGGLVCQKCVCICSCLPEEVLVSRTTYSTDTRNYYVY